MDDIVRGILQARIVEWVDVPFSRGSSQARSPTLHADSLPAEPQGKPTGKPQGKSTGVGSLFLLPRIFPAQESNWGLLCCRQIVYQLNGDVINQLQDHKLTVMVSRRGGQNRGSGRWALFTAPLSPGKRGQHEETQETSGLLPAGRPVENPSLDTHASAGSGGRCEGLQAPHPKLNHLTDASAHRSTH